MYHPQQTNLITEAVARLQSELAYGMPVMAGPVQQWLQSLAGQASLQDYFQHPVAFPSLLLPWWVESTLGDPPNLALQSQLAYSTINGYYTIRLIDNLMDGDTETDPHLLPALNFFHTQFQKPYQQLFPFDHPFWDFFYATWLRSGEAAMQETTLSQIDESQFRQVSAQKVCAAKIPVAAVCYHYRQPQQIEPWSRLVDMLGCWHQMLNDLLGWYKDHRQNSPTYFLTEANQRKQADELLVVWVAREGFAWGVDKLHAWMSDLKVMASTLQCPQLGEYLDTREAMLRQQQEKIAAGLVSLVSLVG